MRITTLRTLILPLLLAAFASTVCAEAAVTSNSIPQGDSARGQRLFGQCRTCHYPEKGFGHHNGPSLWSVFGREAGSAEGYEHYSDEMKHAGFVWTPELLDFWLGHMDTFLPDSTMIVFPLDAQQRADIIAYLQQFHD